MTKQVTERELVLTILMEGDTAECLQPSCIECRPGKISVSGEKERAFITRVIEGTLEHMIELDYI